MSARVALVPRFHAEISAPCVHLANISLIVRLVGTIELRGKPLKPGNIFRITKLNILLLSCKRSLPSFGQLLLQTKGQMERYPYCAQNSGSHMAYKTNSACLKAAYKIGIFRSLFCLSWQLWCHR